MSGWTALHIGFPPPLEDAILVALHEARTLGIEIAEESERAKGPEPPRLRRAIAYFEAGADLGPLRRALAALGDEVLLQVTPVADEAWVERQEANRQILAIGRRLLIVPGEGAGVRGRNTTAPLREGRVVLVVPPKRAFGTGEHATTRQCLELLEELPLAGRAVLDVGTGSAILAMAASALGASHVVGLDNDPEAVEMARENVRRNGEGGARSLGRAGVELIAGELPAVSGRFDVILANLTAALLERMAPDLASLQDAGDILILSGFSPAEGDGVCQAFAARRYAQARRTESGEWAALLLKRR